MRNTLITLAALAVPRAAVACPVCFGQNDSPMAWGVNMGILVMVVVTVGVLAGFATFFIYLARRASVAADPGRVEAGGYAPGPQEGTAQC